MHGVCFEKLSLASQTHYIQKTQSNGNSGYARPRRTLPTSPRLVQTFPLHASSKSRRIPNVCANSSASHIELSMKSSARNAAFSRSDMGACSCRPMTCTGTDYRTFESCHNDSRHTNIKCHHGRTPYTAEPLPDIVTRRNPCASRVRIASAIPG